MKHRKNHLKNCNNRPHFICADYIDHLDFVYEFGGEEMREFRTDYMDHLDFIYEFGGASGSNKTF